MKTMTEIAKDFRHSFAALPQVDYKATWANGTGYFDGAAKDTSITTACCSIDDKGRKLIIVPFRKGELNIVYFERYTNDQDFIVIHHPHYNYGARSRCAVMSSTTNIATEDFASPYLDMLQCLRFNKLLEENAAA